MFKKIASLVVIATTAFFGAVAPAVAAPKLTGTLPDAATEGQTVPLNFALTGVEWEKALVTITVAEGGLSVVATGDVAAAPGYDLADDTSARLAFRGSVDDVVDVLDSGISWHTPSEPGSYSLDFTIKVQEYVDGLTFNPDNGHYYLVPADEFGEPIPLTATQAFANAEEGDYVYAGIVGYVAEINDADENDYVSNYSGGENIWIGATSSHTILNAYAGTSFADHAASLGKWYWVQSAVQFAEGIYTFDVDTDAETFAEAVDGTYNSWAEGEPNESAGDERCVVTNWQSAVGFWNDLNCSDAEWATSFIIEFEPDEDAIAAILTLTDEDLAELADTGVESDGILLAAGALALAGAGAVVYRRRRA